MKAPRGSTYSTVARGQLRNAMGRLEGVDSVSVRNGRGGFNVVMTLKSVAT